MKLIKILLEITMDAALKALNLTKADLSDKDKVKLAYRKASMVAHPDRGGSDEQQKEVNAAYELLSKTSADTVATNDRRNDWEKRKEEDSKLSRSIIEKIRTEFNTRMYKDHLEKIFNVPFQETVKPSGDDNYSVYVKYQFSDPNKDIVFDVYFSVNLHDVRRQSGLTSGVGNISYPLGVSTSVLFKGKKVKIANREYSSTTNHDVFKDPELVLPTKKLQSFESKAATKKFSKADMFQILTKKLELSRNGDTCYKRYDRALNVQFDRRTFMGSGYWVVNVFQNGRSSSPIVTLEESPKTAEIFEDFIKFGNKSDDYQKTADYINNKLQTLKYRND